MAAFPAENLLVLWQREDEQWNTAGSLGAFTDEWAPYP